MADITIRRLRDISEFNLSNEDVELVLALCKRLNLLQTYEMNDPDNQ
jgi:hypothetical protein